MRFGSRTVENPLEAYEREREREKNTALSTDRQRVGTS